MSNYSSNSQMTPRTPFMAPYYQTIGEYQWSSSRHDSNKSKINIVSPISESFDVSKLQSMRPLGSSVDKRRHTHNICERKRREHIKEGFEELQKRLPKKSSAFKMSKLDVLKTSIAYISDMTTSTDSLESEVCQHLTRYAKLLGQSGNPLGPKISEEELESLVSDLDPTRLLAIGKENELMDSSTSKNANHSSASLKLSSPTPDMTSSHISSSTHTSQASLMNLID